MEGITLTNPPLVESIFELRWVPHGEAAGLMRDPHYGLLAGRLYDCLGETYPIHEPLVAASMPVILEGTVQHRFRVGSDKWPLVQLGPGIFTVNDTVSYTWPDFKQRVTTGVAALFESYTGDQGLMAQSLVLRYLNGLVFDFESADIFAFLRDKLKTGIALPTSLFENTTVQGAPTNLDLRFTFPCARPRSRLAIRFARGRKDDSDALIWETVLTSAADNLPGDVAGDLGGWLEDAHGVIEDWFVKLTEGDLLRSFE